MRLSVVIATKDRARYLERALDSLRRQVGALEFEVVVVDNASTDETREVAQGYGALGEFAVHYVYEGEPNRGKARNRGIEVAQGEIVAFCDDDVQLPAGWLAAHDAAQRASSRGGSVAVVNGPILNVPGYGDRPKPTPANYSRAFLCTCNVSVPRAALAAAGGFDEAFRLYGWEDTELGVRLREGGARWKFAWDAYLWHIKPPAENTLEVEARKAIEKARMARRFLDKHPSKRARMATGAHGANVFRGRYFLPEALLNVYAGVAETQYVPGWLRSLARAQLLDAIYTRELVRALDE